MSDNIPFELQAEIIKRVLPVKSLIRFRSVSKQWKSLIDSSEFITHHTLNNKTQPQHLLVRYITGGTGYTFVSTDTCFPEDKYVSIVDDDNFPHHKFSPVVPPTVKLLGRPFMLDCSHGLVCLLGYTRDRVNRKKLVVVWNPLIGKSVGIEIPDRADIVIGFGVCPKTSDPKILKISRFVDSEAEATAEVFTLSSRAWRNVPMNMPFKSKSLQFFNTQVVIDGVIYWLTYDNITDKFTIYSFDLASEEFGEAVDFPYSFGRLYNISKINDSLVVLSHHCVVTNSTPKPFCDVLMMLKNGVPKPSFTELFTVNDVGLNSMIGFRKNGQPIMDRTKTHGYDGELEVYDLCSERMNGLGIYGSLFRMSSFTESLLLLNHSDSIIYP
ncbi:putative F-box domain-containing protein [Helianthus annuus]|uniref:F-box domain-containing protein n=1 Tax=Helianthus annuus TaxID=4232 RepID=A0A9K3IJ30_HELAN|nr:putative F-box protein At3g51171 isoform X1 [Helianthus annuus]KAF5797356.1 putative F-box domain-containing protein [Helianthus annuus]KAJ0555361.1 putative F-box domain-containing protein [Helianthus annuus]KAJ0730243.1 putative F-box domain-containing protein [Helianthus annuus]KAJ0903548.1 putative F-box domain-containing protein [Helianthus annuus]KAJ0906700.1 putative F-box domain-containing protein [Helianthus annuus]